MFSRNTMVSMSITEFARNMKEILNRCEARGEEILLTRNKRPFATLRPSIGGMNALEAMADLYATIPDEAAASWAVDSRSKALSEESKDPWAIS
jgi:antitoxin (DNA-binding transcriptional repressor) of toxin-antitoxin stability system